METTILKTERLLFRKILKGDYSEIASILQDIEVMYAWEKTFLNEEVEQWIHENIKRYENEGYSYFLITEKMSGKTVGLAGPLIENIKEEKFIGIAYILKKEFWNKGYGTESAKECIRYAFEELNANEVIAQIRTNNINSQNVANRLNMKQVNKYIKIYEKKEMEHLIYSIKREDYFELLGEE
ncbi:GCN5 family acetyltransferase [Paraclostridium benzoelyticum]|uniref:GCN5 family acetyltransferase n=1 Tax=Paraclostridium benzoelyticum TaxID=1629550 RepID=A0A0M3DCU2_9FIRM|nr:GNAT family N-acetyltransferase [Paraclostridium benzoelyticum]KKY00455.1 GCN5 family acetyltransferase [Paraclostridium benzoelyticum]